MKLQDSKKEHCSYEPRVARSIGKQRDGWTALFVSTLPYESQSTSEHRRGRLMLSTATQYDTAYR